MESETFSVRIPKELKDAMKKLPVDWQREVRAFIESRVRVEKARMMVEEAKRLRKETKTVSSADLIREDRSR